ncbi:unnamed protein product [Agarophyton chilense]
MDTSRTGFIPSGVFTPRRLGAYPRAHNCSAFRTRLLPCRFNMMADKPKNPLSGLGGLGNIMDAMKKAQEFTSVAKELQEQLKNTEIEASVRDGQVKVTMTAQQVPVKVEVTDDLVALGSSEVSAAVTEGIIAAHSKATEYMREKMGSLSKDFGIPQPPQK